MNTCGRALNASGLGWGVVGGWNIEGLVPHGNVPLVNLNDQMNVVEKKMYNDGPDPGAFDDAPVKNAYWTNLAAGGCVPICAAEVAFDVGHNRHVLWTYLFHGFGGNQGLNLADHATNVNSVYVVFMCNSDRISSFDQALNREVQYYMGHLDPNNQIPNNNACLIYAPYHSLAITRTAQVGVLPGDIVVPPKTKKSSKWF